MASIADLNGTYTREEIHALKSLRIAWSGGADEDFEQKRALLCDEALAALDTTPESVSVNVVDGEVDSVNVDS
jgi:hypothetical protein